MKHFFTGLGLALSGFRLIFKKGIRPFVVVPFLINLAVFSVAIWAGWRAFDNLLASLLAWLPSWLAWLQWLLVPVAVLLILMFVYYSFTLLANLIAAPFNALLAERVEALLDGRQVPAFQGFKSVPGLLGRTVWSELRKIAYQLKWLLVLLLLSIIPGLNLLAPIAWAYFGAWMLSIGYGEYPMGNHGLYFAEVKARLKADRSAAMGMGAGIMLLTLIPVLNFLAMPVGVAAGTALWVRRLDKA